MSEDAGMLDLALCREVAETCASIRLKRTARSVARFYDRVRGPTGLTGTQFSLLVAMSLAGAPTVNQLAGMLSLDQSTLSRNLQPLKKGGLVATTAGKDRRTRAVSLTPAGREKLSAALLLWRDAQSQFRRRLGEEHWKGLAEHLLAARSAVESS